jgi:hypothetical protein
MKKRESQAPPKQDNATKEKVPARQVIHRKRWSSDEDEQLKRIVEEHGAENWDTIGSSMTTKRSGRQCRDRWYFYLTPDINRQSWIAEEDNQLLQQHARIGSKWSEIQKFLSDRTGPDLKNRLHYLKNQEAARKKQQQPEPDSMDPMWILWIL